VIPIGRFEVDALQALPCSILALPRSFISGPGGGEAIGPGSNGRAGTTPSLGNGGKQSIRLNLEIQIGLKTFSRLASAFLKQHIEIGR